MEVQIGSSNELSHQYFEKCTELSVISAPFDLKNISLELDRRDIETEFELLRALTQTKRHKTKLRVNSIVENKKNRYPQQSIYEHSRVILPQAKGEESTYINANEVPLCNNKRLIITQAPLESTQGDFQTMLIQQRIQCVIMLCNIVQNGKVRCFDYVNNRSVTSLKQVQDYIEVVKVKIETKQQEEWSYTYIHYSEWPDRGLPQEIEHLRTVIREAMQFDRIVIHCSAGLGRSGVLGAALLLELKARGGEKISVFDTVRRMREYRFGAVQNNEQYRFIYEYICELSKQLQ